MELRTDRLILRELVESDAQRLFEIESQPRVNRYLTRMYEHVDEVLEYVRGIVVESREVPRLTFDFAVTKGGQMIGRCGMHRDDKQPADAMFWYVLDPAHHGQGYATEAARALLAYSFGELGLHRVWADVDPRNPASMRVCERLGMRKEAHHIENVFIRDEWCDTVIYAMLRREWQPS
jgi:RimJ/RimL family protein N-acetyltransferase